MSAKNLVDRARAALDEGDGSLSGLGLERLAGGMSHAVFAPIEDPALVVKVFARDLYEEPAREWEALVALAGSGLAPEPVHYGAGSAATVVVMTRVTGVSLSAGELGERHAVLLGGAHRRVHAMSPSARRPLSHSWVRAAAEALRSSAAARGPDGASAIFAASWAAARDWVIRVDVDAILSSHETCFSRGDPNLTNYLWSGDRVALIDWENSGTTDPVLELADFAEHASTRVMADAFWDALADATGLGTSDRGRISSARRLMTCFWLVLVASRQRQGRPTTVTLDEQAERTLSVLDR